MVSGAERRRAEDYRNQENSTRLAFASQSFEVNGAGVIEFPDSARFELAFVQRPKVSFGVVLDLDDLANALDVTDGAPVAPLVTGYVTDWDTNERDFYTGCWCAAHVYWTVTPPEDFTFTLDFSFSGIGIKDINPEVRD